MLGWAGPLWRAAFLALLALALVIVIDVVARRRWHLARDVVLAVLVVAAAGPVMGRVAESDWFPMEAHLWSRWGYPELRLAPAIAIVVVAGPELRRWGRVLATWLVPFAIVGAVALGIARPSAALAAFALGVGAGALVRLAFGTAEGVPPAAQVREQLSALDIAVSDLAVAPTQRMGAAEYTGHDAEKRPIKVRVLGHDAQDTQRLARRWRLLAYRDPPRSAAAGRLEQVEHEALSLLMAAQANVRVPEVVIAAPGPNGDALIVTRQPNVKPLETATKRARCPTDSSRISCAQVARLHAAGISHGRLNASNVLIDRRRPHAGRLVGGDARRAAISTRHGRGRILVASTVLVGAERALTRGHRGWLGGRDGRALPFLQPAALTPHLRDLARDHEVGLKVLRAAAAESTGQRHPTSRRCVGSG